LIKLEISYRAILVVILAVIALWALTKLWPIVLLVLTAFIFQAALLPYVEWIVRRGLPRTVSVLIIFFGILGAIAGLSALVVPAMVDEFSDLRSNLPDYAQDLEDLLADVGIDVELSNRAADINWDEVISGQAAVDYGQRALTILLGAITVMVLTAYLLVDTPRLSRFLYQFVPPGQEPEMEQLLTQLQRVVGGYIRGQLVTSGCIFVYTFVVLLIAGVPNAIAFAVLAAFVDIIPLIGATIAVVFPTVAAFQESPTQAIIVLALLLVYQQFEDRFLTPRVYGQTLNLPPLVVLVAVLAGGQLLGIAGVLLAMPAAAIARVGFDYWREGRGLAVALTGPTEEPFAPDEAKVEKEATSGHRPRRRKV
jgi:predicted PurR-regulated permease PerM